MADGNRNKTIGHDYYAFKGQGEKEEKRSVFLSQRNISAVQFSTFNFHVVFLQISGRARLRNVLFAQTPCYA
jgi:hypothetical protein